MKTNFKKRKPIIGIVTKHYLKNDIRPDMYIRDEVRQVIYDNDGIAIGITLPKDELVDVCDNWSNNLTKEEYNDLIIQINLCDGIVIQGGGACDNYEMIVAKYCYDNDIPILGLCCGQNVMVRALGGTTKYVSNPEKHMNKRDNYVHKVFIKENTYLHKIIGKNEMMVNSRHKKTVDRHPNLIVNCTCDDGYIDGVEAPDKKFYIALRFHSESLYKFDENHNKIFKEFINVCKSEKSKH